jgi:hypothetical protein
MFTTAGETPWLNVPGKAAVIIGGYDRRRSTTFGHESASTAACVAIAGAASADSGFPPMPVRR